MRRRRAVQSGNFCEVARESLPSAEGYGGRGVVCRWGGGSSFGKKIQRKELKITCGYLYLSV